ncbi:MAG: hypothetical protein LC796_00390 [Acidobacteria bacterium]|nr:hypothetical protein [Acidobacteriota bacterium]
MSFALLLTTALALAGFLATSIQGFSVATGIGAGSAIARVLVRRHVGWAIPTVLFSLFSQSMVIFYFVGTGRLVKDEVASLAEVDQKPILAALRRFKAQTSPPATFALAAAIAVFVLGAAVHTRTLPSWVHLAASVFAVALHLWAFFAEWRAFTENNRLMDDPIAWVRELVER